jgi:hypothetical protein
VIERKRYSLLIPYRDSWRSTVRPGAGGSFGTVQYYLVQKKKKEIEPPKREADRAPPTGVPAAPTGVPAPPPSCRGGQLYCGPDCPPKNTDHSLARVPKYKARSFKIPNKSIPSIHGINVAIRIVEVDLNPVGRVHPMRGESFPDRYQPHATQCRCRLNSTYILCKMLNVKM